ncbi:scabin-related ADP-ribosyltransferase [Dactylosporangium sp. CA-092794]|uniref:scabin-related ADP-ribosyltransferase n=1 Tax=Dactylosporangium sp. CA-092794 TaxID=3239929 RepID=UPI003D8D37D3
MKVALVKKIADAKQHAVQFVQEHRKAIIEGLAIVGGIAAGLACTAATAGAGAVACMVGASALINLAKDAAEGNIHSWKDALGSAGTGALQGLAGAAGGYLGGVVGGKVACWAATKLTGLAVNTFGKIAAGAISGGLSGAVSGAVSDAVSQFGTTGHVDWGSVGTSAVIGGITGAFTGGRAGKDSICNKVNRHSFDPQTRVLMADGSTKKLEDVEVGDQVAATDPETGAARAKPVTKLWLNHDTDLTDVTVKVTASANAKPTASTHKSTVGKATVALVAAAAVVVGTTTTVLHTTQHHPFWNRTTGEWVNAADLKPGDDLKTDDGATVEVTDVYNFTSAKDMRDLTVADIHTYYVMAGTTPVLVHNCDVTPTEHVHRTDRDPLTRVDNRHPDEIFQDGFKPWNSNGNNDLQVHVDDSPRGNLVSASRNPEGVGAYPWLYDIDAPGGIDLNATALEHGNLEPNWGENEVTFPGGIPARYIRGAQQYDEFDNPIGDYLSSPNYRP